MGKWEDVGNLDEDKWRGWTEEVAPARVRAAVGVTHNLGDYNGVRIDIAIEDDQIDGLSLDETIDEFYRKAEQKVTEYLEEYTS